MEEPGRGWRSIECEAHELLPGLLVTPIAEWLAAERVQQALLKKTRRPMLGIDQANVQAQLAVEKTGAAGALGITLAQQAASPWPSGGGSSGQHTGRSMTFEEQMKLRAGSYAGPSDKQYEGSLGTLQEFAEALRGRVGMPGSKSGPV